MLYPATLSSWHCADMLPTMRRRALGGAAERGRLRGLLLRHGQVPDVARGASCRPPRQHSPGASSECLNAASGLLCNWFCILTSGGEERCHHEPAGDGALPAMQLASHLQLGCTSAGPQHHHAELSDVFLAARADQTASQRQRSHTAAPAAAAAAAQHAAVAAAGQRSGGRLPAGVLLASQSHVLRLD